MIHSKNTRQKQKFEKPNNFTRTNKIHVKSDCINGSIVDGCREPVLFSFALEQPTGHKLYNYTKNLVFKFFQNNKSHLSHIIFYL